MITLEEGPSGFSLGSLVFYIYMKRRDNVALKKLIYRLCGLPPFLQFVLEWIVDTAVALQ